jgi:hypothetical protein
MMRFLVDLMLCMDTLLDLVLSRGQEPWKSDLLTKHSAYTSLETLSLSPGINALYAIVPHGTDAALDRVCFSLSTLRFGILRFFVEEGSADGSFDACMRMNKPHNTRMQPAMEC